MKKLFLLAAIAVTTLLASCSKSSNNEKNTPTAPADSIVADTIISEDSLEYQGRSLNDIRFENWTEDDWLDNDYLRALRNYLNELTIGELSDDNIPPLDPEIQKNYEHLFKSKFVLADIHASGIGGVFIYYIFVDEPSLIFRSWVYSYVNEETEKIVGYSVRSLELDENKLDYTKDTFAEWLKQNPHVKLW